MTVVVRALVPTSTIRFTAQTAARLRGQVVTVALDGATSRGKVIATELAPDRRSIAMTVEPAGAGGRLFDVERAAPAETRGQRA